MAKSKYHTHVEPRLIEVEGWARDGLTDEQIAHNLGIGIRTLYEYKEKYPQIMQSLKRGKEIVDREVENSLLKSALGYSVDEVTKELMEIEDPITHKKEMKLVATKVVTKHIVPNTTAQIFWLKNRKPADWRDKKDVDVVGEIKTQNSFENLTTEQLLEIARLGNKDG